jgi:shikimate kinase
VNSSDSPTRAVLLCGIPGSGKSAVGRRIAEILGIGYADLDEYIETRAGKSISSIFETEGERDFRRYEAEAFRAVMDDGGAVAISLGGGALETPEVRDIIADIDNVIIWLKVDTREAARRLESGGLTDSRPLLRGLRGDALVSKLDGLLEGRKKWYEASDFSIETDGLMVDEITAQVAGFIRETYNF